MFPGCPAEHCNAAGTPSEYSRKIVFRPENDLILKAIIKYRKHLSIIATNDRCKGKDVLISVQLMGLKPNFEFE